MMEAEVKVIQDRTEKYRWSPEAEEGRGTDSPLQPTPRRNAGLLTHFRLQASRTRRQVCVLSSHHIYGKLLQQQ